MPAFRFTTLFLLLAAIAACDRSKAAEPPGTASAAAEPVGGLVPGTPAGDLEQWVKDIQVGLDSVDQSFASDREAAGKRALELYITRQEYLEAYYGVGARMKPTEALSKAVTDAEARFHELITLAGATPPASEADIRKATSAVRQQLEVVLTEAQHSPARLRASEAGKD